MSNAFESFLEEFGPKEKQAFGLQDLQKHVPMETIGKGLQQGLGAAAATAVVGGVGMAASKIFDAATKARDFHAMLELNPDLAEHQARDPRMFNQMFSSLRSMNPAFSKDPLVAGTYMRRMTESPQHAGGILTETVSSRDKFPSTLEHAFEEGVGATSAHFKPRKPPGY